MDKVIFSDLFRASNWAPIMYKGKEVKIGEIINLPANKTLVTIKFISVKDRKHRQGVSIFNKGGKFEIDGEVVVGKSLLLWEDTAPPEVQFVIKSKNPELRITNWWDLGRGPQTGHNGTALYTERTGDLWTFFCNDGQQNDDFDDLIFSLKVEPVS